MSEIITSKETLMFSNHSKDRMVQYGLNEDWVQNNLWQRSVKSKLPIKILKQKIKKYGRLEKNIKYYRRCGYLLTVSHSDKPILVTITKCYSGNLKIK